MKITRLEDIERQKHDEKRDKLTEDINKVMDGVFKKPKKETGLLWTIAKTVMWIMISVFILNFILGNIWLLKFFWGEFF